MDLLNKIKQITKEKGFTMEHIINASGASNSGFYKMLRNNSIKVATLEKIADSLDIPIDYFFTDEVDILKDRLHLTATAMGNIHTDFFLWYVALNSLLDSLGNVIKKGEKISADDLQEIVQPFRDFADKRLAFMFDKIKTAGLGNFMSEFEVITDKYIKNPDDAAMEDALETLVGKHLKK